MPRRILPAIVLGLTIPALAGCGQGDAQPPLSQAPLAGARIGGPFTLTGEDGKTYRWRDFDGDYRIVYFGYTYCPDVCPTEMQRSMAGLRKYAQDHPELAARIQPLFITVDPARDTQKALRQFTDAFHPRLLGLTGTPDQIAQTAKEFAVSYSKGETQPGGGYLVNHQSNVYLFGPQGAPIALLPADEGPDAVARELARWVR